MSKGKTYIPESRIFEGKKTNILIRQITNNPSIHHHPFFIVPAYDDNMNRMIFVSHRTGMPQIFAEDRATEKLIQLTERPDLNEWSVYPSHNGKFVYFTAGTGIWQLDLGSLKEQEIANFSSSRLREEGMVAAAMGTIALSYDDLWLAVRFGVDDESALAIINTESSKHEVILQRDSISHMQFCPNDNNLLYYAGPLTDRVWIINRDGSGNRRLYARNVEKNEWITHESWIPKTKELAFVDWNHGVRCINVDTGKERCITSFNAWHAICNRDGTLMVADTNFPDIGIQVFDPLDGVGKPSTLCYPEASSMGEHWKGAFPYANGPIKVYAPQHTHPHPSFSPDNRYVIFTSDKTGFAQIYEATLTDEFVNQVKQGDSV